MKVSKGLLQAYQLQDFCHEAALALRDALTTDGKLAITREDAQAVKALISSWRDCQERVSFHRRTPAPGVLKPNAKARKRRPLFRPVEPALPTDIIISDPVS